jgi:hypothetical protein
MSKDKGAAELKWSISNGESELWDWPVTCSVPFLASPYATVHKW